MKLNKKVLMYAAIALLGIATVGTTLAFFTDIGEATNVISMGQVGITLEEPIFAENEYNIEDILPGDVIEKDPLIKVNSDSADVYIRALVSFENLNELQIEEIEEGIEFETGWVKGSDGYYYYTTSSLSANEEVYLFKNITIPCSWGNEISNMSFKIKIMAQAIQAANFTPLYDIANGNLGWFYRDGVTPVEPETYVEDITEIY